MKDPKQPSEDITSLIAEIKSLEKDLVDFRAGIEKIKEAPKDKDAHVVGPQHNELIAELEDIANKLENLPKKWAGD